MTGSEAVERSTFRKPGRDVSRQAGGPVDFAEPPSRGQGIDVGEEPEVDAVEIRQGNVTRRARRRRREGVGRRRCPRGGTTGPIDLVLADVGHEERVVRVKRRESEGSRTNGLAAERVGRQIDRRHSGEQMGGGDLLRCGLEKASERRRQGQCNGLRVRGRCRHFTPGRCAGSRI